MPLYEFRCRQCDDVFEIRRSMSTAGDPAPCPAGHADTVRLLSAFASVSGSPASAASPSPSPAARSGGCGAGCGCAH